MKLCPGRWAREAAAFQVIGVDRTSSFSILNGGGVAVEAKVLGFFSVRPVTGEALVGEDGENFAGKVDFFLGKERAGKSGCDERGVECYAGSHVSW